jgi:translation initiation factor IF-3
MAWKKKSRGRYKVAQRDFGPRRNNFIRVPQVMLIDQNGDNVGVVETSTALRMANEAGLDLVEVGAAAKPPVCKIIDYAKYQYELNKKKRQSRKKTKNMKEFQFSPVIAQHDSDTRVRRARHYLGQGHLVRLIMQRKGRQTHEQAMAVLKQILTNFDDYSSIEPSPKVEGRDISITLKPDGKTKDKKNSVQEGQEKQPEGQQESKTDVHKDGTAPSEDQKVDKG